MRGDDSATSVAPYSVPFATRTAFAPQVRQLSGARKSAFAVAAKAASDDARGAVPMRAFAASFSVTSLEMRVALQNAAVAQPQDDEMPVAPRAACRDALRHTDETPDAAAIFTPAPIRHA